MPSSASPGAGTGVSFDSDDFSFGSGGCTDGEGSTLLGVADGFDETSDGNCESVSGGRRSVMILLFLPAFEVDLEEGVMLAIVGDCSVVGGAVGGDGSAEKATACDGVPQSLTRLPEA